MTLDKSINIATQKLYEHIVQASLAVAKEGSDRYHDKIKIDEIQFLRYIKDRFFKQQIANRLVSDLNKRLLFSNNGSKFSRYSCKCSFPHTKNGYVHIAISFTWQKVCEAQVVPSSNVNCYCPVCLQEGSAMSLSCGHLYCTECAVKLQFKACAICKKYSNYIHPIYGDNVKNPSENTNVTVAPVE
tara:strand:+ start:1593 stop:2150 length:558 start_codon:yes stop_codon:yes gene_type:complete